MKIVLHKTRYTPLKVRLKRTCMRCQMKSKEQRNTCKQKEPFRKENGNLIKVIETIQNAHNEYSIGGMNG